MSVLQVLVLCFCRCNEYLCCVLVSVLWVFVLGVDVAGTCVWLFLTVLWVHELGVAVSIGVGVWCRCQCYRCLCRLLVLVLRVLVLGVSVSVMGA